MRLMLAARTSAPSTGADACLAAFPNSNAAEDGGTIPCLVASEQTGGPINHVHM